MDQNGHTTSQPMNIISDKVDKENGLDRIPSPTRDENDYDPFESSEYEEDGLGFFGACVHIIKATIGTGILVLPYMFQTLGYCTSVLLILFVGILYYHTIHVLMDTEYQLCKLLKVPRLTFVGVTEKTFENGPCWAKKFLPYARGLIYLYHGVPTGPAVFLIVIATNVQNMLKYWRVGADVTQLQIIAVVIGPLTVACLVSELRHLVPFATASNVLTLAMAVLVVHYSSLSGASAVASIKPFDNVTQVPQYFAALLHAFRCTGIFIPVKNEMRIPRTFTRSFGVLNTSALVLTTFFIGFGFVTYWNYREGIRENILANLPADQWLSFVVSLLYTLALLVTYVLAFFVRFHTIWTGALDRNVAGSKYKTLVEYGMRIGINVLAFSLILAFQDLALVLAISGTISILVEIALPAALQILFVHKNSKKNNVIVVGKGLSIIIMSIILFCASTYKCVQAVITMYTN